MSEITLEFCNSQCCRYGIYLSFQRSASQLQRTRNV